MKRALYIGLTVLGVIVAAVLVVMAYRGPTQAVQPSADYSRTNQPLNQAATSPSDATAATVSSATPVTPASAPSAGTDSAAAGTTAVSADTPVATPTPAALPAVSTASSSEVAQTKAANPPAAKRGALQAIIDVVSNLQL